MTTIDPTTASMGGPLSEAERIAWIRHRLNAVTARDVGPAKADIDAECARLQTARLDVSVWAVVDLEFLLNLVGELEGQLATAREGLDDWLLAPHHDTGGEYGLYHGCNDDEAVIGIGEQSLRSVLDDVRDHECESGSTAPDSPMDEFEAADDIYRRWE